LPIINKGQYEITLEARDFIDGARFKVNTVKENVQNFATLTKENTKHAIEHQMEVIKHIPENVLTSADHFVDKMLPENTGQPQVNGKVHSNGSAMTNGYHKGNIEHAKCLTAKLARRVSVRVNSKSHDVVDAVRRNSLVRNGQNIVAVAEQKSKNFRDQISSSAYKVYSGFVDVLANGIDRSAAFIESLPTPISSRIFDLVNQIAGKIPKRETNGKVKMQ